MNTPDTHIQLRIRSFEGQVLYFNGMYNLPVARFPQLDTVALNEASKIGQQVTTFKKHLIENRIRSFVATLNKEVDEHQQILDLLYKEDSKDIDVLVELADWFGDLIVYSASEMVKYGIPVMEVLRIIMMSNFSKLQADGTVKYDENGKVEKGPGYWKPEPLIRQLLLDTIDDVNAPQQGTQSDTQGE